MYNPFILSNKDDKEVVEFLNKIGRGNPSILGYHYPNYRDMLEKIGVGEPLYIGLRNQNEKLVALLPGFLKTQAIGTVYSSLPFFGPNAGILTMFGNTEKDVLFEILISFLLKHLDNYEMISASFYSNFFDNSDVELLQQYLPGHIVIDKFTNYVSLEKFKLNSSLEYDIRKAVKSGVKIRQASGDLDVEEIFDIYIKNCDDYGIPPKPKDCLKELIKQSEYHETTKTYVAEYENKIIGALIMIYSPQTASYYLPCSIHEFRSFQPTTLLINHAIQESIRKEIKIWNWESSPSKDSGVYKFKKKWGSIDGSYKVFVNSYKPNTFFKQLGQAEIARLYPYFFVFPFNLL
jgi:hypothetical protein